MNAAVAQQDARAGPTLGLVATIVILIGALWSFDTFLARTERKAVQDEASSLYKQGDLLLKQGRAGEAVELLRRANSMVRDNREYQLAYVTALEAAHKFEDADANLKAVLQADPDNGPANLLAARLMVQEGKVAEAESHYHRAIYGTWPANARTHRIAVHLEFADLLASRGEQQELLAELLILEIEAQKDTAILKRIAHLYLVAGSPGRAANVYSELIRSNPEDIDAYAGLGEVELEQGDYHSALAAFLNANRRGPGQPAIPHDIELAKTLTAIDPTPRQLSSAEKYARATTLLKLARDSLDGCINNHHPNNADDLRRMVADCDKLLAKKAQGHVTNELAEERLMLAEQLWQARIKACAAGVSDQEQPLRLIIAKLEHS